MLFVFNLKNLIFFLLQNCSSYLRGGEGGPGQFGKSSELDFFLEGFPKVQCSSSSCVNNWRKKVNPLAVIHRGHRSWRQSVDV